MIRHTRAYRRWKMFLTKAGVDFEEGYNFPDDADFKVKCYGDRGNVIDIPYDLYIYVVDEEHLDNVRGAYYDHVKEETVGDPVLVVTDIFDYIEKPSDVYECDMFSDDIRTSKGDIYTFNYGHIDGDYFGAYPAFDCIGRFYLFGADSSYVNDCDVDGIFNAYRCAKALR